VIVNSIIFKKELKKKFNVNALCIYNPLNVREIKILSKKKINNNHFKSNNLKLLNIGRLVDQKDQITFLKALNLLKEKIKFKAIIIGNGIKKEELLNFIKKNKLQNRVKIIKFQKNPFTYIKMTDILVHTAKFEGLPNVLLEAAVLKKFIISTNCPTGPSEILLNGKGGELVKIGDYKKIANIIEYYSKRKAKNKITLTSKNLYRFDYDKNLDKYSNVIKKLI
jgi:glycosyltransferase involved in cell wall biosynthesis